MEAPKDKGKKNLIIKTWERCKSIGRGSKDSVACQTPATSPTGTPARRVTKKSKSWNCPEVASYNEGGTSKKRQVAPEGCFSVYVGAQKQKFVVKTEYANHPLFRVLLEQAEAEYGYSSCGPIELPCDVDFFYRVLMEMDSDDDRRHGRGKTHGFGFKGCYAYRLLSPSRMIAINQL